jgi:hypothetical protein
VPGRKATPAAMIPNMAIRNSDVIVQAMERLPLHKASMISPKARRAIMVRYRCVSSRKGAAGRHSSMTLGTRIRPATGAMSRMKL